MNRPVNNEKDLALEARKLLARAHAEALAGRIEIRFNPRMRTRAGACTYRRIRRDHAPGHFLVELNPHLVRDRHPEALWPTLAHELAHVVVRVRHGGHVPVHGTEWQQVMQRMGFPPERCHRMDVQGLTRARKPGSRWTCRRCRKIVTLGPIQTRRERRRRGSYVCLCGGALDPLVETDGTRRAQA
jgi:predicted SprT family Zn-dependent metalloprotease